MKNFHKHSALAEWADKMANHTNHAALALGAEHSL